MPEAPPQTPMPPAVGALPTGPESNPSIANFWLRAWQQQALLNAKHCSFMASGSPKNYCTSEKKNTVNNFSSMEGMLILGKVTFNFYTT